MDLPIIIAGPTACGKSSFALNLAKKIDGEIINADSIQLYQESQILSARPSPQDESLIPHHLYGVLSALQSCSAVDWCKMCAQKIDEISKRKHIPIIVGGTGFYLHALINGIADIPDVSEQTNQKVQSLLEKEGLLFIHQELKKLDEVSGTQICPNDTQRLMRALAVCYETGKPFSQFISSPRQKFYDGSFKKILVMPERKILYERCNQRFLKMLDAGALDEVKKISSLNLPPNLPFLKLLGYKELSDYLNNKFDLKTAINLAQTTTRHYAKRQITWFSHQFIADEIID